MNTKTKQASIGGAIALALIGLATTAVNKWSPQAAPVPATTPATTISTSGTVHGGQTNTVINTQGNVSVQAFPKQTDDELRLSASSIRTTLQMKLNQPGLDSFARNAKSKALLHAFKDSVDLGEVEYAAGRYGESLARFRDAMIKLQEFDAEAVKFMK